jgi:hypothetical protein
LDAYLIGGFTLAVVVSLLTVGLYDVGRGKDSLVAKGTKGRELTQNERLLRQAEEGEKAGKDGESYLPFDDPSSDGTRVPVDGDGNVSDDPSDPTTSIDGDPDLNFDDGGQDGDTPGIGGNGGDSDGAGGDDGGSGDNGSGGGGDNDTNNAEEGSDNGGHPTRLEIRWSNNHGDEYAAMLRPGNKVADISTPSGLKSVTINWNPSSQGDSLCDQVATNGGDDLGGGPPPDGQLGMQMGCSGTGSDFAVVGPLSKIPPPLRSAWDLVCDHLKRSQCELAD